MKIWIQRKRLTSFGIGLIILGIIFLPKGLGLILYPTPQENQTDDVIHPIQLNTLYSVWLLTRQNNTGILDAKVNLDTTTVFDGDSVGVRADAYGVQPDVALIGIIATDPNKNFDNFTGKDVARELNEDTAFNQSIILVPFTNPPFETKTDLKFLQAFKPITFHGFVFLKNGNFSQLYTKEVAFTVLPKTDKLQAETNLATLKQINATNKATIAQNTYNNIVLGLSFLGISVIPILIGTDILLRIYVSG